MPKGKEFIINNSKKISLVILLLAIGFSLVNVNSSMTGLATGDEQILKNLERSQESVNFIIQEREGCLGELAFARDSFNTCQADLGSANANLDACNKDKETIKASLTSCQTEKTVAENQLAAEIVNYEELAKNSVTSICCSFSDFKAGTIKNWGIENNNIVCTGSSTVNCTSGEIVK
jgi:septal ring factor EnvC (AmiA/AmiB activator)